MPSSFIDVCRFNPTLGGTTDWTYSSAVTGYQSPAAAGAVNGAIYSYRAESNDLSQWEVGFGAYNSATGVFSRTTVLFSFTGTTYSSAKISFSTVPQVAIVALSEDLPSLVNANSFAGAQTITNATTSTSPTTGALKVVGGVGIAGPATVGGVLNATTGLSLFTQFPNVGATIRGVMMEFGHSNTAGYGSTIGFDSGAGNSWLLFNGSQGTTGNTYKTWGFKGSLFRTDLAGGFTWGTIPNASADNQSPVTTAALDTNGNFQISGSFTMVPPASIAPANNGQLVIQATSNTSLTFKLKGSDGVVRSGSITLV